MASLAHLSWEIGDNGVLDRLKGIIVELHDVFIDVKTHELLINSNESLEDLRALGEFSADVRENIFREFLPDRLRDTLLIESIMVSSRVTLAVLEGRTISEGDQRGELAILNINRANAIMQHQADLGNELSVLLIREINRAIEIDLGESRSPGNFREIDLEITGAKFSPTPWPNVLPSVEAMCSQLKSSTAHAIVMGCWAHWALSHIHPFENGNGRTARMVQDFFLIRAGFMPVGIPAARKGLYYEALERADTESDLNPLIEIVADSQISALQRAREIALAPIESTKRIRGLLDRMQAKTDRTQELSYHTWLRSMERIRDEIQRRFEELNDLQSELYFRCFPTDVINTALWLEAKKYGKVEKSWLLKVDIQHNRNTALSLLFYVRRHRLDWVLEENSEFADAITVFLDVQPPDKRFTPGLPLTENYIKLREVAPESGGYRIFRDLKLLKSEYPTDTQSIHQGKPLWTGEHVEHLTDTIDELLEDLFARLGMI